MASLGSVAMEVHLDAKRPEFFGFRVGPFFLGVVVFRPWNDAEFTRIDDTIEELRD